jgi:hypothetical protein
MNYAKRAKNTRNTCELLKQVTGSISLACPDSRKYGGIKPDQLVSWNAAQTCKTIISGD